MADCGRSRVILLTLHILRMLRNPRTMAGITLRILRMLREPLHKIGIQTEKEWAK